MPEQPSLVTTVDHGGSTTIAARAMTAIWAKGWRGVGSGAELPIQHPGPRDLLDPKALAHIRVHGPEGWSQGDYSSVRKKLGPC